MADRFDALKSEITLDPLGRGYSGMTDQQVADSLNAKDRTRKRGAISGSVFINAIHTQEYNALTDAQKRTVWDLAHLGELNPDGIERALVVSIFGAGSTTVANLAALVNVSISRGEEIGFGVVVSGNVQESR